MTLLSSQGLPLVLSESLSLPPLDRMQGCITITIEPRKTWWHEEVKDTDPQDHCILKLEDHLPIPNTHFAEKESKT